MQAEPLLRPLALIIKFLVNTYGLSDPYKGGLGSYAITLMVIALLQVEQNLILVYLKIEKANRKCRITSTQIFVFLWQGDRLCESSHHNT